MASHSLLRWQTARANELDEIEQAHQIVGGTDPGRRYATQQLNRAYATLLSSQFQGFCRDLHSECVDYILDTIQPPGLRNLLEAQFIWARALDKGNPHPASIGSDFNRFGFVFWDRVYAEHALNRRRRQMLEDLIEWRNAIAHQDFDPARLGGRTALHLGDVQGWRRAVNRLAHDFDEVMRAHLRTMLGRSLW
jgi:hypothetical protein